MRPAGIITDTEQRVFAKASCNDRRGYCWLSPKDFGSLVLISMLFVEHEREIMPEKPPRVVMPVAELFAKRGSNQKEMSSPGAGSVAAKKPQDSKNPAVFISIFYLRSVQDDHVINHTQIASAYVINKHASARFDRGLDDSS